jgi:hypothetical protein
MILEHKGKRPAIDPSARQPIGHPLLEVFEHAGLLAGTLIAERAAGTQ